MLVFDTTSAVTLEKLESWKKEFINQGGIDNAENFPFIVVGNKCDLDVDVSDEEISAWMKENGIKDYYKISCKSGEGTGDALKKAISCTLKRGRAVI